MGGGGEVGEEDGGAMMMFFELHILWGWSSALGGALALSSDLFLEHVLYI